MRSSNRANALLIGANLLVYIAQTAQPNACLGTFALWPVGDHYVSELAQVVGFRPWQLLTSAFLHGGVAHLGMNMLGLYVFGRDCERALGTWRYVTLFFTAVLAGGVTQLLVATGTGSQHATIGASAGVFGVLLAFATLFPERRIAMLFPPVILPAWLLIVIYGGLELAAGITDFAPNVAHFAHLGGMAGAWVLLRQWRPRTPPAPFQFRD
jgi:membrane associated rhomboid family serine protease